MDNRLRLNYFSRYENRLGIDVGSPNQTGIGDDDDGMDDSYGREVWYWKQWSIIRVPIRS